MVDPDNYEIETHIFCDDAFTFGKFTCSRQPGKVNPKGVVTMLMVLSFFFYFADRSSAQSEINRFYYIGIQLTACNRRKEIKVNSNTELRISKAIVVFIQLHQGR